MPTTWVVGTARSEDARVNNGIDGAYRPIADHGLIGDLQTAALVATDGTIDWFCVPRFDGPSVFASILDHARGGEFRIGPIENEHVVKQLYFPDTAVLITRFMAEDGVAELVDFMPIARSSHAIDRHRIVRILRGIRGRMAFRITCAPRFDYARQPHAVELTRHGAVFTCRGSQLTLHGVDGLAADGSDVCLTTHIDANDVMGMILETGADTLPRSVERADVLQLLEDTVNFWHSWLARSRYSGRWREMVERSAITLKLMTYAPSGALVAAPTAGLPEQIGGERNWDYRYTWVRDGSMSIGALLDLGLTDEAAAFGQWLRDRVREQAGDTSGPLKIMYRVDGSSELEETILPHFEGYRGSRPVRIGNGAADQLQLDIYGEALHAIHLAASGAAGGVGHAGWQALEGVMTWLCDNWDQADEGIWETRGGRQEFVYGRQMTWVAFDRAVRLAREFGRPAPLERWTAARDAVYEQIMQRGWNSDRKAFVQYHGASVLDASVLTMPTVGFLSPRDPMWLSTLDAIERELVSDSLVYRYNPSASPDGLRGEEGTFSICTFWFVEALARSGRVGQARYIFEKMLTYANHLGLYAEEIGVTGEQLGNFPQAFSHLALISAASALDRALS